MSVYSFIRNHQKYPTLLGIALLLALFLLHFIPKFSNTCPKHTEIPEKPIVLLWFWPENFDFVLQDCSKLYNSNGCILTANRSLYEQAAGVLIYHKSISQDLSNLPPSPRPHFQKWIWFHLESPTHTAQKPGLENLFNLTLSYRRDANIPARYNLEPLKSQDRHFVLPKKDKLVCWIVSNPNGRGIRNQYYHELKEHIHVHLYGTAFTGSRLKHDEYYSTISSCKFYLAFENSIHRDYITEKLNGPLAAGTVPVVLGPPRQNYEEFFPQDSFIHVNDFANAKGLADFLLLLDKNDEKYLRYFRWRKDFYARPHLLAQQEFIQPIAYACEHMARDKGYSVVHDLYKWYFI